MAAAVTGSKTVTHDATAHLQAALLTTLLAIPIESLTIAQFTMLKEALESVTAGHDPSKTIGAVLL